jgi:hypothetical protein
MQDISSLKTDLYDLAIEINSAVSKVDGVELLASGIYDSIISRELLRGNNFPFRQHINQAVPFIAANQWSNNPELMKVIDAQFISAHTQIRFAVAALKSYLQHLDLAIQTLSDRDPNSGEVATEKVIAAQAYLAQKQKLEQTITDLTRTVEFLNQRLQQAQALL